MRAIDRLLIKAIEKDDDAGIAKALSAGANANLEMNGMPILFIVAIQGKSNTVDRLLDAKANPNATDSSGVAILSGLAMFGMSDAHFRIADRLIATRADVNFINTNGFSVLDGAASCLNRLMAEKLVKAGAKCAQNQELLTSLLTGGKVPDCSL